MTLVMTKRGTGSYFLSYILKRVERNKNFLAAITGPTGSGKSYAAMRISELLDPSFSIDRVVFTPKEFMQLLNSGTLSRGSVVLFDEAGVGISAKAWQSVQNKLLSYVLQTFRHRNFIVLFTSPHLGFMDASSRKMLHSYMETVGIDTKRQLVKLKPLLLQVNQRSGECYYKYLRAIVPGKGIIPVKQFAVGLPSPALVAAYEEKKTAYTSSLNADILEELEEADAFKGKTITGRQEEIIGLLKEGFTIPIISEKMGVSESVAKKHLEAIKKKGYGVRPIKEGPKIIRYEVSEPQKKPPAPVMARARLTELAKEPPPTIIPLKEDAAHGL